MSLTGSTVSGNSGSGISASSGCSVDLVNSTVSGNSTSGAGGGIIAANGGTNVSLSNSTVSGNTSGASGGGLRAWYFANMELSDSTVSANSSGNRGGGVSSYSSGTISLSNSIVDGNSATVHGGAVHAYYSGTVNLTNSTVSNNTAAGEGGGVAVDTSGTSVVLINSTVSNNTANGSGGGFSSANLASVTLINSTVSGNTAASYGGGIFTRNQGYARLGHSIVSGNFAGGPGVEISGAKHSSVYSVTSFNQSLIGDNRHSNAQAFSSFVAAPWDISATIDGTHPASLASIISPLADNGGPTKTHALVLGSPAIDLIDSTNCGTDQIGQQRDDGFCDIGSFELQTETITINTELDTTGSGLCSLRDAVLSSNGNTAVGACAAGGEAEHLVFGSATFPASSANSITLTTPLPAINSDLTITGPDQSILTIDANQTGRVLSLDGVTVMLDRLTLSGGSASNRGGGIYAYNGSRLHLSSSTISGNAAVNEGGGIFTHSSYGRITNSTVSNNTAAHGGGIYASNSSNFGLTNTTLSANSASGNGGGIAANTSNVTLINSIVAGNNATSGAEILDHNNTSNFFVEYENLFGDDSRSFAAAFSNFAPGAADYVATSDAGTPRASTFQALYRPSSSHWMITVGRLIPMRWYTKARPLIPGTITSALATVSAWISAEKNGTINAI